MVTRRGRRGDGRRARGACWGPTSASRSPVWPGLPSRRASRSARCSSASPCPTATTRVGRTCACPATARRVREFTVDLRARLPAADADRRMRLFLAVWPPDDVLDALAALDRPGDGRACGGPASDQWHVTLRFFGEVPVPDPMRRRHRRPHRCPHDRPLGPATSLLVPRIVAVAVAGLDAVADASDRGHSRHWRPPQQRPFRGHITLARLRNVPRRAARRIVGEPMAGEWPVTAIHVVQQPPVPAGRQLRDRGHRQSVNAYAAHGRICVHRTGLSRRCRRA